MRQLRTSGSVGALGRQLPRATRPDYCYFREDEFLPAVPMARLGQLSPLLTEATPEDWRLLEWLAEYLLLTKALQRLRLKTLSVVAQEGAIPLGELRTSLTRIFEERDEDPPVRMHRHSDRFLRHRI